MEGLTDADRKRVVVMTAMTAFMTVTMVVLLHLFNTYDDGYRSASETSQRMFRGKARSRTPKCYATRFMLYSRYGKISRYVSLQGRVRGQADGFHGTHEGILTWSENRFTDHFRHGTPFIR